MIWLALALASTPAERLAADVAHLADDIGERNVHRRPEALERAATWIETELRAAGLEPQRQAVPTPHGPTANLVVRLPGPRPDVFVVGAHYDTAEGTPGADDNGSGVAALLELARRLKDQQLPCTIELVAWSNEEPPWFTTEHMGSAHHAAALAASGVPVLGVWSLETIGYFDDTPGSQQYPWPFGVAYPDTGNFLGFVGNRGSSQLVRASQDAFDATGTLPTERASFPAWIPGVDWSDHRSYWPHGFQAVMVTDTAPFRNPHYHRPTDTSAVVDADRLAKVVDGLEAALLVVGAR